MIEVADLPERLQQNSTGGGGDDHPGSILRLIDIERLAIVEALKRTNYCKAAAARMLGINVQRLNRCITRMGIRLS